MYSLTSGELYCAVAAKMFQDSAFLSQNHGAVLHALQRCGLDVRDPYDNEKVTETMLKIEAPLKVVRSTDPVQSIREFLSSRHIWLSLTLS